MDNSEVLSDCSESSKASECGSSNLSTLSGLSEYQGEFLRLKELIDPGSSPNVKASVRRNHITTWYENQIKTLTVQLQNSLKENENYKNQLYNLEKKKAILYNDKVETLLKQNNQLEKKLLEANAQIQRLLNVCETKSNTDLQNKMLKLEKNNQELSNQNYSLSNELRQCTYQKSEIESDYCNLKSETSDLKLDLVAKLHCIEELKKKISDQHVELQNLTQNNVKLVHELDLLTTELEYVRKSENWYKHELHQLQAEKSDLSAQLLQNKKTTALQGQKIQEMGLELSNLKCVCDELRLSSLKEKERILKQFENSTDTPIKLENFNKINPPVDIDGISTYYETVISDLTSDVAKIKSDFEHQQKNFANLSRENSEVLAKCLLLQNSLNEKENTIEQLESSKKELKCKLSQAMDKQVEESRKLADLHKNCAKLETELQLKNEEKDVVEKSVKAIKAQFNSFRCGYQRLKDELSRKNLEIVRLQRALSELEENTARDAEHVAKLNERLAFVERANKEAEFAKENYLNEINSLNKAIEGLQTKPEENNNTSRAVDVMEYICKSCNIGEDGSNRRSVSSGNHSDYIKLLLNRIVAQFQCNATEIATKDRNIAELRRKIAKLKKFLMNRVEKIEERCRSFSKRSDENMKMLKALCENSKGCDQSEKYKHLQALLQVKIQEEKDKQRRYERNYRTLLRKVREHMKGRNVAEKHNGYLQELHNNLSDECNTLKLQLEMKDCEINKLQDCVDNYLAINEKLKQKLEKELTNPCTKCEELEKSNLADALKRCKCEAKDEVILNLQHENERLLLEMTSLTAKVETLVESNNALGAKLANLEKLLSEEKATHEITRNGLIQLENTCSKFNNEKEQLGKRLENLSGKNVYLTKELQHINSCLQQRTEEVNELNLQRKHLENTCLEKEVNLQKLITGLKNQLLVFKNEIDSLKNEKYFLQRLCNDLKVALKIHVDHNKALKEYVNSSFKGKEKFDSMPLLSNFPSPTRYDDGYINKLLEENKTPVQETPLSDIQDCLNTLRNEICVLQNQISERNYL
ncbi:paramyosin [Tribolium castaneum]|uniref:paramyosin n=1 Tax=Tribolium castaneum TaxID=7070 RepID=UPI0030FEE183